MSNLRELNLTVIEAKELDSSGFGVNKDEIFCNGNLFFHPK